MIRVGLLCLQHALPIFEYTHIHTWSYTYIIYMHAWYTYYVYNKYDHIHMGSHISWYIYIYIRIHVCSPPKIYFLHPFVCPKFYQKTFCTIKKKKQKKQTKNLREMSQPEFPQSLWSCFFFGGGGVFGLRLLRTYIWKWFSITGLWYSLFP